MHCSLASESPFSLLVIINRFIEMTGAKVRPQDVHKEKLRIGNLPEQEIAYPAFPAGAYHEVHRRQLRREQISFKLPGAYLFAPLSGFKPGVYGVNYLLLASVIYAEVQNKPPIMPRRIHGAGDGR